jgi:hypothetical protein
MATRTRLQVAADLLGQGRIAHGRVNSPLFDMGRLCRNSSGLRGHDRAEPDRQGAAEIDVGSLAPT